MAARSYENILKYRSGANYLDQFSLGSGQVYLAYAPLDKKYNTLVYNAAIFVPLMYKMSYASQLNKQRTYVVGRDFELESRQKSMGTEDIYSIQGTSARFIPAQRNVQGKMIMDVYGQIKRAGSYQLLDTEEQIVDQFAFNYDRKESDLNSMSLGDLKTFYKGYARIVDNAQEANLTNLVKTQSEGIRLWTLFLLLALVFLLLESLLLRLWKAE